MKLFAYDIECYSNFFSITFLDVFTPETEVQAYIKADIEGDIKGKEEFINKHVIKFIVTETINEIPLLVDFFFSQYQSIVGYNNRSYDDALLDFILINERNIRKNGMLRGKHITKWLKMLGDEIINNRDVHPVYTWDDFKYQTPFYESFDIMKIVFESVSRKSLKQTAINLKWYRIQDLPIEPSQLIEEGDIPDMLDYNLNDVLITRALVIHKKDEVIIRMAGSKKYDIDLRAASRSGTADRIFSTLYCKELNIKYKDIKDKRTIRHSIPFANIISNKINFQTEYLQKFLLDLKLTKLKYGEDFEKNLVIGNTAYTFKLGGLHTVDKELVIDNKDFRIYDADVSSFYPKIVLNERICPAHLNKEVFLAIYSNVVEERLDAKHKGDKNTAEVLKIVVNSIFGKFSYDGWLYDPIAGYSVTVNGQLYILTLAERLAMNNFAVISANTDGVTAKVPYGREEEYMNICKQWEKDFQFELEIVEYNKIVRRDVNCYSAQYANGKMKYKGLLNPEIEVTKGYKYPIVAKALDDYFYKGRDIKETILNHKEILDFSISQNVGSSFYIEYHTIIDGKLNKEKLQKTNRYIVTKRGGSLCKTYYHKNKSIRLISGKNTSVVNNVFNLPIESYNLDYNWYCAEAMELYFQITNQITRSMKTNVANGLFDEEFKFD